MNRIFCHKNFFCRFWLLIEKRELDDVYFKSNLNSNIWGNKRIMPSSYFPHLSDHPLPCLRKSELQTFPLSWTLDIRSPPVSKAVFSELFILVRKMLTLANWAPVCTFFWVCKLLCFCINCTGVIPADFRLKQNLPTPPFPHTNLKIRLKKPKKVQ